MDTLAKRRGSKETVYLGYAGRGLPPRDRTPVAPDQAATGEAVRLKDGRTLLLRPIRADDVAALQRGFSELTPEEVRLRFLHPVTELPEAVARSLCDIDPASAIAFVLIDPPDTPLPSIHAVARAYIDPVTLGAEFALVVQHSFAGQGIGTLMMERLITACRERGASEIWGDVLSDNGAMIELCDHLGFQRHSVFQEPGITRVTMAL